MRKPTWQRLKKLKLSDSWKYRVQWNSNLTQAAVLVDATLTRVVKAMAANVPTWPKVKADRVMLQLREGELNLLHLDQHGMDRLKLRSR